MGWKFLEAVGEKVAAAAKEDNEAMATELTEKVAGFGFDIDDLEIEFSEGVATVSGIAADEATVEKTILVIGNTRGVSEVEADGFAAGNTEAERAEYAKARREAIAKAQEIEDERERVAAEARARIELRERRRKAQAAASREMSKFHEVKRGNTLSKIAKEYYGDGSKWPTIFEANQPMLKNPDLIYPGQVLRIPPLDA